MDTSNMRPSREKTLGEMQAAQDRDLGIEPEKRSSRGAVLIIIGVVIVLAGLAYLAFAS